jgi:murein DD-endopeptidase MepM/ murein hydrolase activator NlpD
MKLLHKSSFNIIILGFVFCTFSCTTQGPAGLFGKKTPHDAYSDKITNAGLKETALGRSWFTAAEQGLSRSLSISLPYSETGYFAADKPEAVGIRFKGNRGEKLNISLTKKPAAGFSIYMDLWELGEDAGKPKWIMSADTTKSSVNYEVRRDGFYIIRLQPELLVSGEYNLSISTGPSLAFPVPAKAKPRIGSFWGDDRDAGGRRHEGIDIFAAFRTPLVAAANGTVNRVEENNLGGKVVFFRPYNKDYTLYYAHLDEQLVTQGQTLKVGDTLGLMGKTGNAASTAPHLHFGIYTNSGAINPLAFINPVEKKPTPVTAAINNIGKWVRTASKPLKIYGEPGVTPSNFVAIEVNSLLRVQSATAGWYKVVLPDGQQGYIQSNAVASISNPIRKTAVQQVQPIFDEPNLNAARKASLNKGEAISVLAGYKDYYFVSSQNEEGWIPKAALNAK